MKIMKDKENNCVLKILVVDNDAATFKTLVQESDLAGNITASHALTLQDALTRNKNSNYDIILLKDRLPDGPACDAVTSLLQASSHPELLVYTQEGDPGEAELILSSGCWDYIVDPYLPETIVTHLKRLISYRREKSATVQKENENLHRNLRSEGIVGSSRSLQHCLNLMIKAARSDASILISGESGTGKELFALSIHSVSSRADRAFVVVDCAALTPTLVESTLFGHVRGAFTGADRSNTGLIKLADGGTLLLDEIGELGLDVQKKFLRVLQEQTFRPVGSSTEVRSNFRLVAATNRNLQDLCKNGEFREDLLFRLQTFHLELPPLRERQGDITELAYDFRDKYCRRHKIDKSFSTGFLMILNQYNWPGNIRELFHALEHAFATSWDSEIIYPLHLPTDIRIKVARQALESRPPESAYQPPAAGPVDLTRDLQTFRDQAIASAENKYLLRVVADTGGDLQQCLKISGLSRSRFYALLKKHNISM